MFRKSAATIAGLSLAVAAVLGGTAAAYAAPAPAPAHSAIIANPEAPQTAAITRYAGETLDYTLNGKPAQDWMGSYLVNGKITDCLTPGKTLTLPTHYANGVYGTPRQSAEISYIDNHWAVSSSGSVSAGARIAMLEVLGRLGEYKNLKVPAQLAAYAKADITAAAADAGPYKASVTFPAKPTTPGQKGSALFTLKSAAGRALAGTGVRFTAASATIGASGSSGRDQAFTRTSPFVVGVSGVASVSSGELHLGTAGPADQTLVSALATTSSASGSYQARALAAAVTATCNCDGTGTVTGVISQAAGAAEGRYTLLVNGAGVKTITLAAGKRTGDIVVVAADKSVVTFTVQYLVNGAWTAAVPLGGSFTVHCPALPDVTFSAQCDCTAISGDGYTTTVTIDAVNPSADYTDELIWKVNGVKHAEEIPPSGSAAPVTVKVGPAGSVTYYALVEATGFETPTGIWSSQG